MAEETQRREVAWLQPHRVVAVHAVAPASPYTALLAVANAQWRWSLREQLMNQGFGVFGTGNAQVALDWVERRRADVVIADVLLPGTRIAIPHVLRRRSRTHCPRLIGISDDAGSIDELRRLLGYDLVLSARTPVAVLTRAVLRLLQASPVRTSGYSP